MNEGIGHFRPVDRGLHELLIVDDDPASRYATARLLRGAGFRTREAATGAEGLLLADDAISAMVLDVHLPDIDGFELCRLLRSQPRTAHLPVLHLTAAYVTDDDKVRGLDSGADAYLTHPVEPAVLVATVQALVRTHAAEREMRHSEAKFRSIYNHAPGGICLLGDEGAIVHANPALLAMLGRDIDGVVGRRISEFAPPDWRDRVAASTRCDGEVPVRTEFPLLAADGSTVHVEWTGCPHIEPHLTMGVATDISARVELERQREQLLEREQVARSSAERMSRMKDDLIAVLSHELRTPLNAIVGWTHVLQTRGGPPELMRGLGVIQQNARSQAHIISDILDMSRLNVGKLRLRVERVDPAEVVAAAIDGLRPLFEQNEQTLAVEMEPAYRPIRGDAPRLQQVVWNLLSNAAKFSPRRAEIRLRLTEEEQGVRLVVSDQGRGIPPEALPFIFDRFTQTDPASNRLLGGLGLGLAIVRQLVEAHGGTVAASSDGVDRGATFEVWLPSAGVRSDGSDEASLAGDADRLVPKESIAHLRVLVVEDDENTRAMLELILADHGATVRSAGNYDDALGSFESFRPDVLVSDIGMPGRDGYELIREIRRREASSLSRRVPAIALTSFTRHYDQVQALAHGFDTHCPKPLKPVHLIQEILRLTATPRRSNAA